MSDMVEPINTIGNWTPEMDELLQKLISKKSTAAQFMNAFPSKSLEALRKRASKLGIKDKDVPMSGKKPSRGLSISKPKSAKYENLQERKCMTCGAKFMSHGVGNRLCVVHRSQSADNDYAVRVK